MSYFVLACLNFVLLAVSLVSAQALTVSEVAQYKPVFNKFIETHGKVYKTEDEHNDRFNLFVQNMKRAQELQRRQQGTATYGVTQFSDMSADEFKKRFAKLDRTLQSESTLPLASIPKIKLPKSFDWRKKKAVTAVKNQGSCGACWAFSTTGNIEGLWAIKHKKLLSLSEQQLVDCDTVDAGCDGGLMTNAYSALAEMGGLQLEKDYPYSGSNNSVCALDESGIAVSISGGVVLPKNEIKMAKWLVKNGPISVGLNSVDMQLYTGGISHPTTTDCDTDGIDHGVLIVGFGISKNIPYWIVKNSWGTSWGEKGYYRVYRGAGVCGLNAMASSAVL